MHRKSTLDRLSQIRLISMKSLSGHHIGEPTVRCLVEMNATRLEAMQKGTFFAFRRFGEALIYGITLNEPDEKNAEVKILLLNPNFQQLGSEQMHRIYSWPGNEECISFGLGWVIVPSLRDNSVQEHGNPPKEKQLALAKDGLYLCATHGNHGQAYPYQVNIETLEFGNHSSSQVYYLSGYKIYLSARDYHDGRPPIYERT